MPFRLHHTSSNIRGCPSVQSIKDDRSQGEGFLSNAEILRTMGEGVETVLTFFGKGEGQFFAILCGRLLWTVPKHCLSPTALFILFVFTITRNTT